MNEIVFHIESYDFDFEFYYSKYFQKVGLFLDLWRIRSYYFDSEKDYEALWKIMNKIVFHIESYDFDYEFYYGKSFRKVGLFWI